MLSINLVFFGRRTNFFLMTGKS